MIYRIRWQASSHSHQGEFRNHRKHKGEPKLPFNLSLRALFIIEGRSVVVFGNRGPVQLLATPIRGQEQTYFFER
ncbi:hypothetical protein RS3R1_13460 [Pseudomonas atacamensis]|uniref:Uncharacterized protein n=1 Tax=Pseudomonas atacamensis TaxID=2565368 RepID=A0ABQ5PFF9_9PSED|nr:hypothetical protein RS3R1_13460 [Pseudomonas atacamensis]